MSLRIGSVGHCLPMMHARHPHVAEGFIVQLEESGTPCGCFLKHLHGVQWLGSVQILENQRITNLASHVRDGNTKLAASRQFRRSPLRTVGSSRSGTDSVASNPRSRIGSHSCSHVLSHEDRSSPVQGDPVAASPFAFAPVSSHVPVRPSNRFVWPPPCCM